jgi:hypothetical protein
VGVVAVVGATVVAATVVGATVVVTGAVFVAVTAGAVVLAWEPGIPVVAGGTVLDVQLKTAVKIKIDRTKIIKALPVISFCAFTV